MKSWKRRNATLLFLLFALSITSVSFSAWVNTEMSQSNVNVNLGVGNAGNINSFVIINKQSIKPLKFCPEGFVNKDGNDSSINITQGKIEFIATLQMVGIKKFFDNATENTFYFSTKLTYANGSNKSQYLINNELKHKCYYSIDGSQYSEANVPSTIVTSNETAITKTGAPFQNFGASAIHLKLEYIFDITKYVKTQTGTNFNWFEENLLSTLQSGVSFDISVEIGG